VNELIVPLRKIKYFDKIKVEIKTVWEP